MKFALFLVLALSAVAMAGPAFNKNNQINQKQQQQQQQTYMTATAGDEAKSPAVEILKQWCFSSQMSQQELTASFKKLVNVVKSSPVDQTTEAAVMGERICQGAIVQKSQQSGQTYGQTGADAKAHELIKDVYMDALISCKSRECTQQLLKVISSQQVDSIRASYYMTRIAVTDKQSIKDGEEIKQFAESFIQQQEQEQQSEAVERQKLFATTALLGKWIQAKPTDVQIKEVAQKVAQQIVERYVKQVGQQEVEQYKQTEQPAAELAKKIAKRSAALKALANIPGHVLKQCAEVEQVLVELCKNKQELSTVRQSAIECLEQNEKQMQLLKQLTFDQEEPIEVRIAAYRALMTIAYQQQEADNKAKEQMAQQIVEQIVKHCEQARNQQQDDQFVLYAVSHLDNIRTSQQPEHQAIKETIAKNKQHYMQIQVLSKKFKQQLADVRSSSRNYKLEQEFNQLESGLVLEGDLIYESKQHPSQQQQAQILPKVVRVNMSMPIMGETVNVIEVTLRQNQMDEEILSVLKLVKDTKFDTKTVSKVVDSFKSSVEKQQQQQQQKQTENKQVEADLTIKVDGCTIVYLCVDDVKSSTHQQQHQRIARSIYNSQSIFEEIVEYLKRQPVNFNRGFNLNINERLAKLLDVEANILAGLRFESRAQGSQKRGDFEIVAQMEPRFSFEAVVGPAKVSSKKLLQRLSTKTALGMRLRYRQNELVDVHFDLPMNQMELFTVETQIVEKSRHLEDSYTYLPESIYGEEDIYASYPIYSSDKFDQTKYLAKRSIFDTKQSSNFFGKLIAGKSISRSFETPEHIARATGLRGKLRVAASPKDMSYLVSAIVQKYEPSMEGFRVKVEQVARQGELEQCLVTVSTPGSRTDRTMSIRLVKQQNSQRTLVKAEVQSPRMSFAQSLELVHDGRQYSLKTELVSRQQSRQQWRHALECGLIMSQPQSSSGRLAQFAYKPYLQIDSTALKRPVQMQGQIAYQQSPKSVISYELKCPTTGDFVQGKLIVDQRDTNRMASQSQAYRKQRNFRRSMQSPIELLMSQDITLTHELIAQVQEHALKVHNMADWSCQKYAMTADSTVVYKNLRKASAEQQLIGSMKLGQEQQSFSVERKCPTDERKEYIVRLNSIVRPAGHQMEAECRYNGRRQSLVAYKHKVEVQKVAANKYETSMEMELVDTERQVNEKFVGRARLQSERKQKALQCELSSRSKSAKLSVDFESLAKHQIVLAAQCERFQHKTEVRNNQRQFFVQSRTENKQTGQLIAKMLAEVQKQAGQVNECKFAMELPAKRVNMAADLKLESGKRSSLALQTERFASQCEFSFETIARPFLRNNRFFQNNLRFRSSLKDLAAKQAYWMDSAINAGNMDKQSSYIRLDSPIYRTDLEFDPREQLTKFASFARSKRSTDSFNSIYDSNTFDDDKSLSAFATSLNLGDKLNLGQNKLWMLRSIISSPFGREQLKQQVRRALFQFADRRQSHQHQMNWSPVEQRLSMDFAREPNTEFVSQRAFEPMRARAALNTNWERPSTMAIESEWLNADVEMKPFDELESYAKISALSRHPRSTFKKHESEFRYKKDQGYKAWMKHQDQKDRRHEWELESDVEPSKYAKMAFNSEKHGKAQWEHKWRREQSKRAAANGQQEEEMDVFRNKFALKSEGPEHNKWEHETTFEWEEPAEMVEERHSRHHQKEQRRPRRSYNLDQQADWSLMNSIYNKFAAANTGRYSPIEYLKHTNARLVSQQTSAGRQGEQLYKLDFDYQPSKNYARLNMDMPEEMLHSSEIEIKPEEKLYKLASKFYNRRTQEPSYQFLATTKPHGLATAEQEPIFVHAEHPMFERPISKESLVYQLFKQPLKIDYSDKFGRQATIDYDQSPMVDALTGGAKFAGLRQKRAAVFYKDDEADFEHNATFDFYPETLMGQKIKQSYYKQMEQQQQMGKPHQVAFKTQTKYGPIVMRADSSAETCVFALDSPLMKAKLIGETGANMRQLFKVELDNKSQRVQLGKLLRQAPATIRDNKLVKKFARKFDSGKFEHQSELLVSLVEQIFKVKSASKFNERPIVMIEAEFNQQQQKVFAKVNGERVNGQAVVDLVRKSADLVLDCDDKHTMHHVTRLVRTSDKFYSLESMTTYKSRPVFKLIGKVSAMIFEPEHLFASRRYSAQEPAHVSTFEAVLYEPKEFHITGQFDCDKKEARVIFQNVEEERRQETIVRFDDETQTIHFDSRLNSQNEGQIYVTKAKLNLPGLYQAEECQYQTEKYSRKMSSIVGAGPQSCQSELIYMDKSGNWSAKYVPGDYMAVSTPRGKQTINLAGYNY